MKLHKSNLDEMQEQKLLKIEHTCCWIAFGGLLAAMYIQIAIGNGGISYIGGECIVLLIMSVYLVTDCIRNGIWDRRLKPNAKTNLTLSLTAGLLLGGIWSIISYRNYHKLIGSIAIFAIIFISVTFLVLAVLSALTAIYQQKKKQLDDLAEKEEHEQ